MEGIFMLNGTLIKKAAEKDIQAIELLEFADCVKGEVVNDTAEKMFEVFKQGYEAENPVCAFNLGVCYASGKGIERNLLSAVECLEFAFHKGVREAENALSLCYVLSGYEMYIEDRKDKNISLAFDFFKKARKHGSKYAEEFMIMCLAHNPDADIHDIHEEIELAKPYALEGDSQAAYVIFMLMLQSSEYADEEIDRWNEMALRGGYMPAIAGAAADYEKYPGDIHAKAYITGCKRAMDSGKQFEINQSSTMKEREIMPKINYVLGMCYLKPSEDRNIDCAVRHLKLAAEQGCVKAMTALGVEYSPDGALIENEVESVRYLNMAIDAANDQMALFYMGGYYGRKNDFENALLFFKRAAAGSERDICESSEDMIRFIESKIQSEKKKGCYIATAVYGSYDCPEVWVLRRFRDGVLSSSCAGRAFIRAYYAVSPALVRRMGGGRLFNAFWRRALDPFVRYLKKKGFCDTPYRDSEEEASSEG